MRRRRNNWEGRLAVIPFKSDPTAAPKMSADEMAQLNDIVQAAMFPLELLPNLEKVTPYLQEGHRLLDMQHKYMLTSNTDKDVVAQEVGYPGALDVVGTIVAPSGVRNKVIHLPDELGDKVRNILMFKEQYRAACTSVSTFVQKYRMHTPKQVVDICPELQWILKPEDLKGRATTRPLGIIPDTTELREALSFIRLMGGL